MNVIDPIKTEINALNDVEKVCKAFNLIML